MKQNKEGFKPAFSYTETNIAEVDICKGYTMLGNIVVPILAILIGVTGRKGTSFAEAMMLSCKGIISNPYLLCFLLLLCLFVFVVHTRVKEHKLYLTKDEFISQTGIFKLKKEIIPLTDIKSIYALLDNGIFVRYYHFGTIELVTNSGMKRSFQGVKHSKSFVDKVNRQILLLKQKSAGLSSGPDL